MGDLNKKAVAEQTEGVGAWKSRQKVNKMFLARTIKNQMVTELMFEKQRKVKQLNTEAADEEKKSKKKRRKNSTSSSDSEIEVINENEKECLELTNVEKLRYYYTMNRRLCFIMIFVQFVSG